MHPEQANLHSCLQLVLQWWITKLKCALHEGQKRVNWQAITVNWQAIFHSGTPVPACPTVVDNKTEVCIAWRTENSQLTGNFPLWHTCTNLCYSGVLEISPVCNSTARWSSDDRRPPWLRVHSGFSPRPAAQTATETATKQIWSNKTNSSWNTNQTDMVKQDKQQLKHQPKRYGQTRQTVAETPTKEIWSNKTNSGWNTN